MERTFLILVQLWLSILARVPPHHELRLFHKIAEKTKWVVFTDPKYEVGDNGFSYLSMTPSSIKTLERIHLIAATHSVKGVAGFSLCNSTGIVKNFSNFSNEAIEDKRLVSFEVNLEIKETLLLVPIYRTLKSARQIRLCAILLTIKTENVNQAQKLEDADDICRNGYIYWIANNSDNINCLPSKPWSSWFSFCERSESTAMSTDVIDAQMSGSKSTTEPEGQKDILAPNTKGLIIGATVAGSASLIIFAIVVCRLIQKLREFSNRRVIIRRSQLRSSFFRARPEAEPAYTVSGDSAGEQMPDVLKRAIPMEQDMVQNSLSPESDIYEEPDEVSAPCLSVQVENEIYSRS